MGWTYWALNGEDSFDLLDNAYDPAPVSAAKQSLLASIQFPLSGGGGTTTPPPPPPTGTLSCAFSVTNSWSGGFQGQVVVSVSGNPVTSWKASWTWPSGQSLINGWNATFTTSGTSVTAVNASYNGSISPGGSVTIGFTANGSVPSSLPITC
jgi:endoglucanase